MLVAVVARRGAVSGAGRSGRGRTRNEHVEEQIRTWMKKKEKGQNEQVAQSGTVAVPIPRFFITWVKRFRGTL